MDLQTQRLMMAAAGAGGSVPYIDDVFSTYVYKGNESARAINNGIDLSGKGGLVWVKSRNDTHDHHLVDTERGANDILESNTDDTEATIANRITGFNSNGFNLGSAGQVNGTSVYNYSSWTFRKAPGFFDIVTYTGTGSSVLTLSHDLGSIPGMILIKRLDGSSDDWIVYHHSIGITKYLKLNTDDAAADDTGNYLFNNVAPTSTHFTIGAGHDAVNANTNNYVAYLFAGGESTTATARSVNYLSTANDILVVGSTSDLSFGTGDFTVEGWFREDVTSNMGIFQISGSSDGYTTSDFGNTIALGHNSSGWNPYGNGISGSIPSARANLNYASGSWIHFAYTRASGTNRIFINGDLLCEWSSSYNYTYTYLGIGTQYQINNRIDGQISNFRVVKGTAVYTSPFKVPTGPLTNITNTVLLCCNNSSVTGSTVGTVTTGGGGGVQPVTDSPFEDSTANVFGENEDQNVIKTGSYIGNGAAAGPVVYLGWEPQFVLVKNADSTSRDWTMWDSMRGMVSDGNDPRLKPNATESEGANNAIDVTPTGFKIVNTASNWNQSGNKIIYLAIRRPDGYVGKPADSGTDVFAMDTGNSSSTIPAFTSGFPVDFGLERKPATSQSWMVGSRLTGDKYFYIDNLTAQLTWANALVWDSNEGWIKYSSYNTDDMSWMWKRHAGFDVVTWIGDSANRTIPHSLGKSPEMIWIKNRSTTNHWIIGHKGLNGGTNPWEYYLRFTNESEFDFDMFQDNAPTSTHFDVKGNDHVNEINCKIIALLFASVDGISKVGYYTGTSSSPSVTITTGFSPRLLIIKRADGTRDWNVFDTVRGIGTGTSDDKRLLLSSNAAQNSGSYVNVTSTGFTVQSVLDVGTNGGKYIYYAHA